MGLNIKNPEVEQLAAEIASMMRESKTEAIRRALLERRSRLQSQNSHRFSGIKLREYMEKNVWPLMPERQMGRRLSREEEDQILGYGPQGW